MEARESIGNSIQGTFFIYNKQVEGFLTILKLYLFLALYSVHSLSLRL